MREGWKEVAIGEFGKVITGKTPPTVDKSYFDGEELFVSPKDLDFNTKYIHNTQTKISVKALKKFKNQVLPKNAIMYTSLSYGFGKIGIASKPCLTNQQINSIIVNDSYNHLFVYYLMVNSKDYLLSFNSGIVTPIIPKSSFEKIKVFVPNNIEIQRKIANILSGYDDLIENNLKRIKILEEMAQQTYEEWFVRMRFPDYETAVFDESGLPEGWEKVKLDELVDLTFGYPFKANDFNNEGKGTQIIRIRNIPNSTTKDFTTEIVNEKYYVENGDILIGMDGEFYVNVWTGNKSYLVQRVCRLKAKDFSLQGYILEAIKAPIKIFQNSIDGATVAHLGKKHLDEIVLLIPKTITESLKIFQNVMNSKVNLESQNQRLRETRDILLPRLMMGMIDVSESLVQVESVEAKPTDAKIIPLEQPKKEASKEFKEAVLIACLTERFGSEKFPLGRKRYTKLSYLFHRYSDNKIQDYLRKAAGPYNPKTKYGGPEKIALNSKYIQNWKGDNGTTGFVAAEKIDDAKKYFSNYWQIADLDWLTTEFKFKSNDELELLATVDNSLVELFKKNLDFTVANVLDIIKSEKEWEAKLERAIFSDAHVEKAIGFLKGVLEYGKFE